VERQIEASDWAAELLRHTLREATWPYLQARFSNPPQQDWVSVGLTPAAPDGDVTLRALVFASGSGDGRYQSLTLHRAVGGARERSDTQLGPSTKLSRHPAVAAGQLLTRLEIAFRSAPRSWREPEDQPSD
jgi:hypothetical protein